MCVCVCVCVYSLSQSAAGLSQDQCVCVCVQETENGVMPQKVVNRQGNQNIRKKIKLYDNKTQ